eukprot:scaffold19_cov336-Pinguiococcus_pyrenoidosus.AAC.6
MGQQRLPEVQSAVAALPKAFAQSFKLEKQVSSSPADRKETLRDRATEGAEDRSATTSARDEHRVPEADADAATENAAVAAGSLQSSPRGEASEGDEAKRRSRTHFEGSSDDDRAVSRAGRGINADGATTAASSRNAPDEHELSDSNARGTMTLAHLAGIQETPTTAIARDGGPGSNEKESTTSSGDDQPQGLAQGRGERHFEQVLGVAPNVVANIEADGSFMLVGTPISGTDGISQRPPPAERAADDLQEASVPTSEDAERVVTEASSQRIEAPDDASAVPEHQGDSTGDEPDPDQPQPDQASGGASEAPEHVADDPAAVPDEERQGEHTGTDADTTELFESYEGYSTVDQRAADLIGQMDAIEATVEERRGHLRELLIRIRDTPQDDEEHDRLCGLARDAFSRVNELNSRLDDLAHQLTLLGRGRRHDTATAEEQRRLLQEAASRAFVQAHHTRDERGDEDAEAEGAGQEAVDAADAAEEEGKDAAPRRGQAPSMASVAEEGEQLLAPYRLSPRTFDPQRYPTLHNQFRERIGHNYLSVFSDLAKWFVILRLEEDEPNQQAMTEKLSLLQLLAQDAFALPRNVALQVVLLHVAIMARLFMFFGTNRRMAVVESWNFSVSVLGGRSLACSQLRDELLGLEDDEAKVVRGELYEQFKQVASEALARGAADSAI